MSETYRDPAPQPKEPPPPPDSDALAEKIVGRNVQVYGGILALMGAGAAIIAVWLAVTGAFLAKRSEEVLAHWSKGTCTIESSKPRADRQFDMHYSLVVDGKRYEGSRFSPASDASPAPNFCCSSSVACFYDPKDPSSIYLEAGRPVEERREGIPFAIVAIPSLLVGAFMLKRPVRVMKAMDAGNDSA